MIFIKTFVKCVLIVLLMLILVSASIATGAYMSFRNDLQETELDIGNLPQTTFIYDTNGNPVAELYDGVNRTVVDQTNNKHVKNAVIAIEDERFWQDKYGLDFKRIFGAALKDIRSKKIVEGGSGIQQQLVKNLYLTSDRTFARKIKELFYTLKLNQYPKEQILNAYLNTVYFGENAYGVEAAAEEYFGKNISGLDLSESATLAGIINSPDIYDPYKNMDSCIKRRNIVLKKMLAQGYISNPEYDKAVTEKLNLKRYDLSDYGHKYFIDYVIDELIQNYGQDKAFKGGLRVYTTLNPAIQQAVENQFMQPYNFPDSSVQGACVVEDNAGNILAMVGGRDFPKQNRCLNRAYQVERQPGSAIKPLTVYSTAIENGENEYSTVDDAPVSFGSYSPHNFEGDYWGFITYKEALAHSRNVPAVRIASEMGITRCIEQGKKFGLKFASTDYYLPAVALGGLTHGETPIVMCTAYSAIARNGVYVPANPFVKITDSMGNTLNLPDRPKTKAVSEQTANQLKDMLLAVVQQGTGINAQIPGINVYGKTGTASDYKDAWFCGFTDKYTAVVWMGYDNHQSMDAIVGGTYPATLWKNIMSGI